MDNNVKGEKVYGTNLEAFRTLRINLKSRNKGADQYLILFNKFLSSSIYLRAEYDVANGENFSSADKNEGKNQYHTV